MGKLGYYVKRLKQMNMKNFKFAVNEVHKRSKKNRLAICLDMFYCSFKYLAGYMDYYYYFFETASRKQRKSLITRGVNNGYIKKLNNQAFGYIFDEKTVFNERFKDFIKRDYIDLRKANRKEFEGFAHKHKIIILKPIDLQCGKNIEKINVTNKTDLKELYNSCIKKGQLLIEECVKQHDELNKLYPNCVNTLRIVTARVNNKTTIMFRCIRIGNGKNVVDNFNHGGMYSIIDENGIITKPAIDKKSNIYTKHPVTGATIEGFKIPYFKETIEMCKKASEIVPEIGLVGWDVAITPKGPLLIEGNNYPGYDIYQSRVHLDEEGKGLREFFDQVIYGDKKCKK